MLSEKYFVMFCVVSFPPGVYVVNLIASIPGPPVLTLTQQVHETMHVELDVL